MAEDFLKHRQNHKKSIYSVQIDHHLQLINIFPSYEDHLERMSQVMCKRFSPILKYSNIVKTARPPVTYWVGFVSLYDIIGSFKCVCMS